VTRPDVAMLALTPAGVLTDVTAPAGASLTAMYRAIDCHTVTVVSLTDRLDMWLDDEGLLVESPVPNLIASHVAYLIGQGSPTVYVGTAVFAGHNRRGDTVSLSVDQRGLIMELVTKIIAVQPNVIIVPIDDLEDEDQRSP
jgi:hypothetical protein